MMTEFKIGQKCIVKPVTFNAGNEFFPKRERGTITYIHPLLRYVIVSVQVEGGQLRESFFPGDVQTELPKKRKR